MSGALIGFLSGIGDAGVKIGQQHLKAMDDDAMEERRQNAALEREKMLMRFKADLGDQQRIARTDRVNTESGKMADEAVGSKRALIESGVQDKSTWTPEQQAAVDQSLKQDRGELIADPRTRAMAAARTGDLSEVDAMKIRRDDIADKRADNAEERAANADATRNKQIDAEAKYRADALAETVRHNKALESAAAARTGAEKLSPAAKVQLDIASSGLGSAQKELSLAAAALNAAQRSNEMDPTVKDRALKEAKADYAAAKSSVAMAMEHYNKVGKAHLGEEWQEIEKPEPAAAAPKDVKVDGKVIGKASSPEEADKVVSEWRAKQNGEAKKPNALIGRAAESPAYTPPAGSRAAQAVEERRTAAERAQRERDDKMMADAKKRLADEEETRRQAAEFKARNR